jgi:hypothetical protein
MKPVVAWQDTDVFTNGEVLGADGTASASLRRVALDIGFALILAC